MIISDCIEPVLFLELYPSSAFEVFIEVIDADGGTRCASTTVAALALADAGIPMKNLVSSVSIGKLDKQLVVDLIKKEEDWEEGEGPTDIPITMTHDGKLTHIQLDGKIGIKQLKEAVELAKEACKEIYEAQKKALKEVGEKQ